jgi:hypothetical protein
MQYAWKYKPADLRRLTEAVAEIQETVRAAIQVGADASAKADFVEDRCSRARDDVFEELRGWLKDGQVASFLYTGDRERHKTDNRYWESLPDGDFWSTVAATRVLVTGTATSKEHPRKGGIAYIHAGEFDALAKEYIVERGLKLDGLPPRFRFRKLVQDRPTPAELDGWMVENVHHWVKRYLTIAACCHATGATSREAAAAFGRLPADKKLGRGKKPPSAEQIGH